MVADALTYATPGAAATARGQGTEGLSLDAPPILPQPRAVRVADGRWRLIATGPRCRATKGLGDAPKRRARGRVRRARWPPLRVPIFTAA